MRGIAACSVKNAGVQQRQPSKDRPGAGFDMPESNTQWLAPGAETHDTHEHGHDHEAKRATRTARRVGSTTKRLWAHVERLVGLKQIEVLKQVLGSARRGRRRGLAGRQPRDSPRRLAAAPASAAHSGTCAGHIPWECATLAMSSTIWQYTRPVCPAVVPHTRLPGPNPMPGGVAPRG